MAGTQSRIADLKREASRFLKAGELEKAWPFVSDILNINFDDPQGLFLAGNWFRQKGHPGMATQMFRRCVALTPDKINPWLLFGACLHDGHNYEAAIECFQRAKQINPNEPACYANMAATHVQLGEFADALNYATEALKRDPKHKTGLACRGMALLGLGRWEGFKDYKHIYGGQVIIRVYNRKIVDGKEVDEPEWDGTSGKTVVVQSDQGLGDEIMYSSVLPDMAKDCKKVILECHPKLENVFKRSFPQLDVYGTKKQHTEVKWIDDYEIDASYHISGLGRFYRTKDKDFPRKPYLLPSEELRAKWREKLSTLPRPWVGLAWMGGMISTMREYRSVDPQDWWPVMEQGGSFIDLSYHDSKKEIEGLPIHRFEVNQKDYDDTLALLAELDVVITVTTTAVHACGAIGKKAFVLVNNMPQWRYGTRREDMQWYHRGVRLFRRQKDEDSFEGAIGRIAEAYKEFLEDYPGVHRLRPEGESSVSRLLGVDHLKQQSPGIHNPGLSTAA
jgi:tetratricopeptide (TPR) repeat protein